MSGPKPSEWVNMNLDTGAAANTCPSTLVQMGQEMEDSIEQSVVSVSLMVELGSFKDTMKTVCSHLTGVHKVLCSAGEIVCKGQQDFHLGSDGGFVIPVHSTIGQEMRVHFERLVNWYGRKHLIPVYIEDNIFNFYLSKEVKFTEPIL